MFRRIHDVVVVSAVIATHLVYINGSALMKVPGDLWHKTCIANAGPRCRHRDCPPLHCHPGVHKLEQRHASPIPSAV